MVFLFNNGAGLFAEHNKSTIIFLKNLVDATGNAQDVYSVIECDRV